MKINPRTAELFTDSGQFLKTLFCPLQKSWGEMTPVGQGSRVCDSCYREVHDTSAMSDDELLCLIAKDPEACLTVSPTQENCTVLPGAMQNKAVIPRHDLSTLS